MLPVALHIKTGVGTTSLADPGLTAPRGDQCSINCPLHYNDMCNVTYNYWYARMSLLALFWWFILLCKHIYFIYQNSKVEGTGIYIVITETHYQLAPVANSWTNILILDSTSYSLKAKDHEPSKWEWFFFL